MTSSSAYPTKTQTQPRTMTMAVEGLSSKNMTAERARDLMSMSQDNFDNALAVVRHMCDEQIQQAAKSQMWSTVFPIPTNLFGYDHYDVDRMGRRLAESLFSDGYSVQGSPKLLNVIWGKEYKMPLTKAMLIRKQKCDAKKIL